MSLPDAGTAIDTSSPSNHYLISIDASLADGPRPRWALARLAESLSRSGTEAELRWSGGGGVPAGARLVVTTSATALGRRLLADSGIALPDRPESFAIFPAGPAYPGATAVCASDATGLSYAALDLADLIEASPGDGAAAIAGRVRPVVASPLNRMRGVARSFVSERDKTWFYDEDFWAAYLTSLASSRFNRFHLALGIGYDSFYHADVTDTYFLFPYPFLVDVPGFDVSVDNLPAAERERNLRTLGLIGELCAERGLHFQLGLWTHGIEWADQDNLSHPLRGLTAKNHAAYSRAALAQVLAACPGIDGVTLRVHGESGISEAADDFWREVFGAVAGCGRRLQLDLHSKGLSQPVLDAAVGSGAQVVVSPKFAAEHMGLPYHLTDIRPWEQRPSKAPHYPRAGLAAWDEEQIMLFSAGARNFTRYSYGDFLRLDRDYDVLYRVWPGTQRLLEWADPVFASALARSGTFCGSGGVEICEPLFFLGRRGSLDTPVSGGPWPGLRRSDRYADTYRTYGRALYGPSAGDADENTDPGSDIGTGLRAALAYASRILPLVTAAHCPSAANNHYWPEMYTNMPIVAGAHPSNYGDTPLPQTFGSVSPLDPALFASADAFVAETLADGTGGRYSPIQVASWLERLARDARAELASAHQPPAPDGAPDTAGDISILAGLGLFFAGKMRAAVLYGLSRQLSSRSLAGEALAAYRSALEAWEELARTGSRLYGPEAVFGPEPWLRGLWADRTEAIGIDVTAMADEVAGYGDAPDMAAGQDWPAFLEARSLPPAPATAASVREHVRPDGSIAVAVTPSTAPPFGPVTRVVMKYRDVDQSQRYVAVELTRSGGQFTAAIPAPGEFPEFCVQYYLVLETVTGTKWIYPGIGPDLCGQPYRVIDPHALINPQNTQPDGGLTW
jgi:hypothetical protein